MPGLYNFMKHFFHMRTLKRYTVYCLLILYQDGVSALMHRLRLKIASLKKTHAPERIVYHLENEYSELSFPERETPLVSIVIPVYNKAVYTYSCLKSLFQNVKGIPYEVIIVDDGSDDVDTAEMLSGIHGIQIVRNESNQGFISSCNVGAGASRGRHLFFLNNDTLVLPGCLDVLLSTFDVDSSVGLAGCKLIYPDGRLQEAGGIIWRDGSGWNYGRFDDPDKPEYSYMRQVDYCSGAAIMIPRQLFFDLKGFDTYYSPAYYEDADLAFRVRAAGFKAVFQPGARVVHFEGITSGTDLNRGVKRYQEINRKKFLKRWKTVLASHRNNGIEPILEKDRYSHMKILVVDARMVTPDRDSGSMRMFNILKILIRLGCQPTFATSNLSAQRPYVERLQAAGVEVLHAPYIDSLDRYLSIHGSLFYSVVISRVDTAEKHIDRIRKLCPRARVVFDTVDVHYIRENQMARIKRSAMLSRLAETRKRQELSLVEKADVTLVVSPVEKEALLRELPNARIEVLSNIHEIHETSAGFRKRAGIVFIGGFEHPPNLDAVEYYCNDILPLVRRKLKGVVTYIIGSNPPKQILKRTADDLIVTGYVADIEPYLNRCRVSVAPLRFGAGVKGKINLSMSYGLPVVATPVAIEGMRLAPGLDVLTGEGRQEFADALVALYQDEGLWAKLSENGKANIRTHFSALVAKKALEKIFGKRMTHESGHGRRAS